jgi:hypothetical protein
MQSSFGSLGAGYGGQQSGHLRDSPVNGNDDMKTAGPVSMGGGIAVGIAAGMSAAAGVGLGIALSAPSEVSSFMTICTYVYLLLCFKKRPPSRLVLSSSNAALKESAAKTIVVNGEDDERGHMSDVRLKSLLSYYIGLLTTALHRVISRLTLPVSVVESSVGRTSQPSQS